jgi:glycosyltransferase involved in cell wall biosynthesis
LRTVPAPSRPLKVAFIYSNPRDDLPEAVAAGEVPDSTLLGQNHMQRFGIDASIHRPRLRRTERRAGLRHRVSWNLREFPLPWELGDVDAVCTPLVNIFPLTARLRGRPRVVLLNFGIPTLWGRSSRVRRRLLKASLESVGQIVCLAGAHRDRLVQEIGLDSARVFTAELGVDGEFFRAQPLEPNGYVLAMGKDLARDYHTFLEAVRGIDARVVVVTSPHLLKGLQLPSNVEVRGRVPWPEMSALYAGARCFALPIRAEGYRYGTDASGLTALLEAMATGRPIVATERTVFGDYVEDGGSALLVPPDDPNALRAAIERVMADDELADGLGAQARAAVDERLTTPEFARRLAAILTGGAQLD